LLLDYVTYIHINIVVNILKFYHVIYIHTKLHLQKLNWKKDTKPVNFGDSTNIEKHNAVPS